MDNATVALIIIVLLQVCLFLDNHFRVKRMRDLNKDYLEDLKNAKNQIDYLTGKYDSSLDTSARQQVLLLKVIRLFESDEIENVSDIKNRWIAVKKQSHGLLYFFEWLEKEVPNA